MPVDEAAIERLLSWDGIGIAIERRIVEYEAVVRSNAPYRASNAGVHLVDSIDHTHETGPGSLVSHVGCNPEEHVRGYAIIVHNGSKPHPITPRSPRQSLRFRVGGRMVHVSRVNHPGTQPDRFLTDWMKEIVR